MNTQKATGIVLAVIGLAMIILGFINPTVVDAFNIYWMAAFSALIPGIFLFSSKIGESIAVYIARIVVGSLFVVSGLIKANDTVGFGIKLQEYFDENALGSFWANFHDWAFELAIFISVVEVILGIAVLLGARVKLTVFSLLAMTIFFGWLTYFTASCNDAQMAAMTSGAAFDSVCVTDCGCFGDALRGSVGRSLTPWESFYKDLALFFLIIILFVHRDKTALNSSKDERIIFPLSILAILAFGGWLFGWMFPTYFTIVVYAIYFLVRALKLETVKTEWILAIIMAVITFTFAFYTNQHLPVIDYRPYKVGNNINDEMKSAAELGLEPTIYANVYKLTNKATGEEMTINSVDYLKQEIWKNKDWEITFTSPEPIVIQRGYEPTITGFIVEDDEGTDIGDQLINNPDYSFLVISYNINLAEEDVQTKLNNLASAAEADNKEFVGITSSAYDAVETFRHEYQVLYPYYNADEIFLKTIIRSNPGLLLLKNGTIIAKWHHNDIPEYQEIKAEYFK